MESASRANSSGSCALAGSVPILPAQRSNIAVRTCRGSRASIEILLGASSTFNARHTALKAPFEAQYAAPPAHHSTTLTEDIATTFIPDGEYIAALTR